MKFAKIIGWFPPIIIVPAALIGFPIFVLLSTCIPLRWNPLEFNKKYWK
jgi:hypothetical protein